MRSDPLPLSQKFNTRSLISNTINAMLDIKVLRTLIAEKNNRDADSLGGRKPVGYNAFSKSRISSRWELSVWEYIISEPSKMNIMGMGYNANFRYYINETKMFRGRMKHVGVVSRQQVALLKKL